MLSGQRVTRLRHEEGPGALVGYDAAQGSLPLPVARRGAALALCFELSPGSLLHLRHEEAHAAGCGPDWFHQRADTVPGPQASGVDDRRLRPSGAVRSGEGPAGALAVRAAAQS